MIKIIDNLFEDSIFKKIKEYVVFTNNIPFYYTSVVDFTEVLCDYQYNFQLCHTLYNNFSPQSESHSILNHFYERLNIDAIIRAKINFNPCTEKNIEHGYHVDTPVRCLTAVYYFNTNDGYTRFETGEKIFSVENRIVIFDSSIKHTGSTCTDAPGRYVLNLNFFSEKYKNYIQ